MLFLTGTIYAQNCCESGGCYIRLDDISGVDTDTFQNSLQAAACRLVQAFPEDFRRNFRVYDFGFYLHNEHFDGSYLDVFEQVKSQIDKPYYLLFGKQTDSTGVYNKIIVELKLPPERSLSICFTEKLKNSLETTLQRYVDNEHDEYTAIKWNITEEVTMEYLESKIYHIVNCCVPPTLRDPNQTCSWCFTQFDDAMSMLENEGYFDFGNMLEYLYGQKLNIAIDTHSYTKINSSYQILFKDEQGNYEYNFTDALEYYKENYVSSSVGLDINVKLYDDIPNDILCYGDDNTSAMPYVNSSSKIEIVVLNYHKGVKVYAKADVGNELPQYVVNLYANKDHWKKGGLSNIAESKQDISSIMLQAFNDAKNIWAKNGYDMFQYNEIKNNDELNELQFTKKSIFYNFIKYVIGHRSHPFGMIWFVESNGKIGQIQKKEVSIDLKDDTPYGNFVNIGVVGDRSSRWLFKLSQYKIGYTLAHEMAHLLSLRGLYLIKVYHHDQIPPDFPASTYKIEENGGHFNPPTWKINLLTHGKYYGSIKLPKNGEFTDLEKMNRETIFLITIFIKSTL